jgi:hypothetical protein
MEAGDIILCHSKGIIGASIRFAQRRVKSETKNAKWNHVAVLKEKQGDDWVIIQAEAAGVTDNKMLSSVAPGGMYQVVPLPPQVNRADFLNFLHTQISKKYGWLTIVSCALDMFLPDSICLRRNGTWICSGLVAGALWFCGYAKACDWQDLYTVTPAEIANVI